MMIGVVIPAHSRLASLKRAIASLETERVVVVDDSPRGLGPMEGVTVVRTSGEEGFASAANHGLSYWQSRGVSRVLLVNDDAVLQPGCLDALDSSWTAKDGAIAPVVHEPDGPVFGIDLRWFGRVRLRRQPGEVGALSGAVMLLRSSERFDSEYPHGFEDIDLCCRLRKRGLSVRVVQTAHATHEAGGTVPRRSRTAQRTALSGHLRWVGGGARGAYAVALSVVQIVREGGPYDRFLGVIDAVTDHRRQAR